VCAIVGRAGEQGMIWRTEIVVAAITRTASATAIKGFKQRLQEIPCEWVQCIFNRRSPRISSGATYSNAAWQGARCGAIAFWR